MVKNRGQAHPQHHADHDRHLVRRNLPVQGQRGGKGGHEQPDHQRRHVPGPQIARHEKRVQEPGDQGVHGHGLQMGLIKDRRGQQGRQVKKHRERRAQAAGQGQMGQRLAPWVAHIAHDNGEQEEQCHRAEGIEHDGAGQKAQGTGHAQGHPEGAVVLPPELVGVDEGRERKVEQQGVAARIGRIFHQARRGGGQGRGQQAGLGIVDLARQHKHQGNHKHPEHKSRDADDLGRGAGDLGDDGHAQGVQDVVVGGSKGAKDIDKGQGGVIDVGVRLVIAHGLGNIEQPQGNADGHDTAQGVERGPVGKMLSQSARQTQRGRNVRFVHRGDSRKPAVGRRIGVRPSGVNNADAARCVREGHGCRLAAGPGAMALRPGLPG